MFAQCWCTVMLQTNWWEYWLGIFRRQQVANWQSRQQTVNIDTATIQLENAYVQVEFSRACDWINDNSKKRCRQKNIESKTVLEISCNVGIPQGYRRFLSICLAFKRTLSDSQCGNRLLSSPWMNNHVKQIFIAFSNNFFFVTGPTSRPRTGDHWLADFVPPLFERPQFTTVHF